MEQNQIVLLGSCRLSGISHSSYIHRCHHVHNSKEAIQYLRFINGDIDIPDSLHGFVFRGCFLDENFVIDRQKLQAEFTNAKFVFIELCSRKKYIKEGYFIHHLAGDKGDAPINNLQESDFFCDNYKVVIQGKEELAHDILEISELVRRGGEAFDCRYPCRLWNSVQKEPY